MRRGEKNIFRAIGFVTRFVRFEIHVIGNVEQRLTVLDRAALRVRGVPVAQISERFYRRFRAE